MGLTDEGSRARAAAVAVVMLIALGHASPARAQDATMCQGQWGGPPAAYSPAFQYAIAALGVNADTLSGAATDALGPQLGMMWINDPREGWSVAVALGPLDLEAARAAIEQRLTARLNPEQAAFVEGRLSVWATPYGEAELRSIESAVADGLQPLDQGWGIRVWILCVPGDAGGPADGWRVTATLYTGDAEPSPELIVQAAAVGAPYGDEVRVTVTRGDGRVFAVGGIGSLPPSPPALAPPAPKVTLPVPRVARYVSLPRSGRCVRGRAITVRARKVADLRRLKVAAPSRRLALAAGEHARVRLAGRRARLTVKVLTRDGRTASRSYTFRRCSA